MMTETTTKKQTSSCLSNSSRIILAEMLSPYLKEYLESIGVSVRQSGKKYAGSCPVHKGDNNTAFVIYPEGHTLKCNWSCFTHHCEKQYGPHIIGLTRGVLKCSEEYAIRKICDFLGVNSEDIKTNPEIEERIKFIIQTQKLNKEIIRGQGWPRANVRSWIEPSDYFVNRGYNAEVLNEYDVGICSTGKFPNRVIVPVYDLDWQIMLGFTARTTKPRCLECDMFHFQNEKCPETPLEFYNASKWVASTDFALHHHLYNYWRAKKEILKDRYIILVEGPGETWKLAENGEHHSLALFGVELTDEQLILLEKSGAYHLFIAMDSDEAGQKAIPKIKKQCERIFNTYILNFESKDIGEMGKEDIKKLKEEIKRKI